MLYSEAYTYFEESERMHWLHDEVPLGDDVLDYQQAEQDEKTFIEDVMKLFTHNDIEVSNGYNMLMRVFKPTEVQMMLGSFNAREGIHIAAYSLFTETIGFDDDFYTKFLEVPEMKVKIDYLEQVKIKKYEEYVALGLAPEVAYKKDVLKVLAVYATITEGVSLFAQFAMLLKYQTENKYKGLGTIVEWSIKDEEMHVQGNSWLFRKFVEENPESLTDEVKKTIYSAVRQVVQYEKDLVDKLNPPHMDNAEVKRYIEYIADQRLKLIGFKPNWEIEKNPLPFMEELTGTVLTNFFEGKVTEYTKGSLTGDWKDVR